MQQRNKPKTMHLSKKKYTLCEYRLKSAANHNKMYRAHKLIGLTWGCLSVVESCIMYNEQVVHRCKGAESNDDAPEAQILFEVLHMLNILQEYLVFL